MAKILIADDSDAIRLVLKDILSIGEHEIVGEASDGAEAVDFYQKYTHKIKGLAPMMGKESLGDLSSSLDNIFKKIVDGENVDGVFNLMQECIIHMKKSMNELDYDFSQINEKIKQF